MFLLGAAEFGDSEVPELEIAVLFAESRAEELTIIPVLDNLAPKAFVLNSAERTSLAALAVGATEVTGVAGLISTRF